MLSFSELLESPEWKLKRKEIVNRDRHKCQVCFNYNHLHDLQAGCINRSDINYNELCLGWNVSGLQNSSIVEFNGITWMLFINDRDTLGFNDHFNYIVYLENKANQRSIIAISEVDFRFLSWLVVGFKSVFPI